MILETTTVIKILPVHFAWHNISVEKKLISLSFLYLSMQSLPEHNLQCVKVKTISFFLIEIISQHSNSTEKFS